MQTKWWGWGALDKQFPLDERPAAWPYLQARLGLTEGSLRPPVELEAVQLPPVRLEPALVSALEGVVGEMNCSTGSRDRLTHAYGKSYRDLVRLRRGEVRVAPDAVVYPTSEAHIEAILALAAAHGFAVVPFGGGTSVVGGLEPGGERPYISLDLGRLNEVLSVDPVSQTAVIQAGILGPRLEEQLAAQGFTLGHYPQSWEYSSLGGWLATRSSGQQATRYGTIAQMVLGLRMVMPAGTFDWRAQPAAAQGPDLVQLAVGSEGLFGVITQATMRVHPLPERRDYRAMLFPTWEHGLDALRAIMQSDYHPATMRLSDPAETEALLKLGESPPSGFSGWAQEAFKWYLRRWRDIDVGASCLLVLGFEGSHEQVERDRDWCQAVCEQNRAASLGQGLGERWHRHRFELPYLRDTLMDRGVLVDALETAATWSQLPGLYQAVREALEAAIRADGLPPLVLCHIAHPYHAGASLYVTFAAAASDDELAQWARYKQAATDAIVAHGGALSHHHGVGRDHAPWLDAAISPAGHAWLRGIKAAVDPAAVMNPGDMLDEG